MKLFHTLLFILALTLTGCDSNGLTARTYLAANQDGLTRRISVDQRPLTFVVEPGTPARGIGQQLQAAGLIADATLFEAYVRVNGLAESMNAGSFILTPSMNLLEIVAALQNAQAASATITIPEGWRSEQIGDYLAATAIFSGTDGLADDRLAEYRRQVATSDLTGLAVERYPFLRPRPAGVSLEGYLFPDTYALPLTNVTVADVLGRQLDNFAAQVVPLYQQAVASGATKLELYEVLTLASIVEREAVVPGERATIAGVYLNRLAAGIKLDADPTVQYALGYQPASNQWWKTPIFLEEYSTVDSLYNTYLHPGLPPGPHLQPWSAQHPSRALPGATQLSLLCRPAGWQRRARLCCNLCRARGKCAQVSTGELKKA